MRLARTRTTAASLGAAAVVTVLIGALTLPAGAATTTGDGDVTVTNTETVQVRLDATGGLREARVYEQLALTGTGTTRVVNPVSSQGLRNLDGFGRFSVEDGAVVTEVTVDGDRRLRSVSDFDGDLPLRIEVTHLLDGEEVEPRDVVGRSGTLEVRYKVTNVTGRFEDVTYDDGTGTRVTTSAETVLPMIGQLVTTLPPTFTDVTSGEASIAGDGRGGTRMTYQMTLFPPIGSPTVEFGYTAQVRDAVVPPATVTSLPVSPLASPSFKGGSASLKSGADSGVRLTAGAMEIDANLLRLHDGAAQLLDGLLQLRAGADELSAGLRDEAVPGADQIAAGAGQLDAGLAEASSKAPALITGLEQVSAGLDKVDAGLVTMYGTVGELPAKAKPLRDGIAQLQAGIGTKAATGTLLNGVDQLRLSIGEAGPGLGVLAAGVYSTDPGAPGAYQKLSCAIEVLTHLRDGATPATRQPCYASSPLGAGVRPPIAPELDPIHQALLTSLIDQLTAGVGLLANPARLGDPNSMEFITGPKPAGADATLQRGLTYIQGRLQNLATPGLARIECGLSSASLPGVCDTARPGLLEGLSAIDGGVTKLVTEVVSGVQGGIGSASDTQANATLRGGLNSLEDGVDQIAAGGQTLISGLNQLGDGAGRLSAGAGDLANGLADAADGSGLLAEGLGTAAESAPQLVDGAQRLSVEGTSQLVANGKGTSADYGVKYAVIEAGAARAAEEGMAYGAPEGAAGATAYSIEIAGVDGGGAGSAGRGLAAVGLFAGGLGLAGLVRRQTA
ncbi:hypothetical protein [Cellulomonas fimi]|uniref:Uncharacterized protein n=1 Tax=Cellulomonas fimi TaxID=1708 RepID=A0A7Y0LWI3_CELFI|nr:hypothetical protein [Cellulomonas fimi]NMR19129.1 hypothetical protein [Cellulomonas fimi]